MAKTKDIKITKIIIIIISFVFFAFSMDQMPPQEQIYETIRCPRGRIQINFKENILLKDTLDFGNGIYGKANVDFLTWLVGSFDFRPLSITYYVKENDTVRDNVLMLKGTDISILLLQLNPIMIDTVRKYYAEFSTGFKFKSIIHYPFWIEGNGYLTESTDKVINPEIMVGFGLQTTPKSSFFIDYYGNYTDLGFTVYSHNIFGKKYYRDKIEIDGLYLNSKWFGFTAGCGYWLNKKDRFLDVSFGIRLVNWFHIPFERLYNRASVREDNAPK